MTRMAAEKELPGLDLSRLAEYVQHARPGLFAATPSGEVIAGGRSNLSYLLDDGARRWVLRRPPLGHVLATAHDMSREYRVITALADTDVPVPHAELHCDDADVIGAPFYLMEWVPGTAMRTSTDAQPLSLQQRHGVGMELIDVLARLHEVDPASVGLADFGKPEGFLNRQVSRWQKQLDASRSRDIDGIDELHTWLERHIPTSGDATIVHGDYRLDNVLVSEDPTRITAVLDWEMATLGDPLTDLGLMHVYWLGNGSHQDPITGGVTALEGFPSWGELARTYVQRTGRTLDALDWYIAFAYFKLAVVLEGIHYRYQHGDTVGSGFGELGELVPRLVASGLDVRG
jgi:aminoglycoside phosphotransferase (APT) family kinase protein